LLILSLSSEFASKPASASYRVTALSAV